MLSYIDLEVDYKRKLLKLLESISCIKVTDEEGNTKIIYIKEVINDKVTS